MAEKDQVDDEVAEDVKVDDKATAKDQVDDEVTEDVKVDDEAAAKNQVDDEAAASVTILKLTLAQYLEQLVQNKQTTSSISQALLASYRGSKKALKTTEEWQEYVKQKEQA